MFQSSNIVEGSLGFKGERGYSAYEIAVQNGYIGTEEEWLEHLAGETTNYVSTSDVVDNLTSTYTTRPLSANQGKQLKALVDSKASPSAITALEDEIYDNVYTKTDIGSIPSLNTSVKSSIVGAINCLASGEIIASKLNASSGYIKYSNGFMIEWQSKSVTSNVTLWVNSIYIFDVTMDDWEVPFTSIFHSWASSGHPQFWTSGGSATATNGGLVRVFRPNSTDFPINATVYGIGLWK